MKIKTILNTLILGLLVFGFAACNCIEGEGPVTEEMRDLKPFNEIELDIQANVYLYQDTGFAFKMSAQQNLHDHIETRVSGDKLNIGIRESCYRSEDEVRIEISIPELEKVELNGSGNIKGMTRFEIEDLEIDINGSGDIRFDLIGEEIDVDISGSGDVQLKGTTQKFKGDITGSGNINAENLTTYKSDIGITGSGNCSVYVHDYLKISITGSGDVIYGGTPELKSHITGSGSVKKLD
ncbi:MAG: DUF2807 domain-containing protein [Bacteroidales bacterium]|nr:DUF2807 domain-containing protein [Bacteroidales bacterium]MCF8350391.1 DUF2807 domain-containing protein [Bacteroidales bacterium]MCF8375298.1 DUF2807 domain-containing protein [Bacteroidales bacterium]MCF8400154.1 DUF2807 domain-containing protein [Bacteroidales bacterium]